MKKVINIILGICIIALIYIVYGSIMGPIRFANDKGIRDKAVIGRLVDIKNAQYEYNHQHNGYCDNFDTLIAFIKTAQLPTIRKIGNLTDDQLEAGWKEAEVLALYEKAKRAEREAARLTGSRAKKKAIEADTLWEKAANEGFIKIKEDGTKEFLFSRDTIWTSLYDSLYHGRLDPDSIRFIPYSQDVQFELTASSDTSKAGVISYTFEAKAPYEAYLGGLDKQEIINLLEDCDDRGRYRGMKVDNNSGNWE